MRRATAVCIGNGIAEVISIHALREEGDRVCNVDSIHRDNFNPRPPRGGRPILQRPYAGQVKFQSTPSARRATLCFCQRAGHVRISIHALREESDAASAMTPLHTGHFNPRSPWGERREQEIIIRAALEFQSTLSVGRATKGAQHTVIGLVLFQSTPSARRATFPFYMKRACSMISIHALREEGDQWQNPALTCLNYFNPRPPRGGRQVIVPRYFEDWTISIHALREEGDKYWCMESMPIWEFQSTPSARRATQWQNPALTCLNYFNPRPPRGGRPVDVDWTVSFMDDFNPRPPRGGRPCVV